MGITEPATGQKKQDYAMQKEIGNSDFPAIVMMHMPENLVLDSARKDWNSDLYINGHTYGGIWRLPFVGASMHLARAFLHGMTTGSTFGCREYSTAPKSAL